MSKMPKKTAKNRSKKPSKQPADGASRRRQVTFLVVFIVLLAGSFSVLSLHWVNDHVVEPFTAGVAWMSGIVLDLLGQDVVRTGTVIRGSHFAVNIENGCNGVETMLIFLAAVVAFPATWRWRLAGLGLGVVAIQVVNLIRVVALFLTGVYLPDLFDTSHTVIWQTLVILSGVALWIVWANRSTQSSGARTEAEA